MEVKQCFSGQEQQEQFSLLCIALGEQSAESVRRVARRVCRNVRRSDCVLYAGRVCAVVFAGTPLSGAQAAARRLRELLVDVEYELQVLSGAAAVTMLQHLRGHQAVVVRREEDGELSIPITEKREREQDRQEEDGDTCERETLPQLSVLSQYPTPRVLHLFPYELAQRYRCIPVGAERSILTLATCQRLEADVIAYFQEVTRRNIFLVRCEEHMVDDVLLYWQRMLPIAPYTARV